ncbi:thioredoxin family protein [uncultured Roseovarius sp.]|uniref:thioredoxin family protein n=1 Tax=uncultured Roseovarius sp. TaxID=293344 RepID=UPI00261B9F1C|nr:thioredoxin family protein [uncultured Roseovarius sp.]
MLRKLISLLALICAPMLAAAVEMGDDGLHKTDWMRDTFKDLREDLTEANDEGKRLALIFEQRGCIYCTKMHNEVFPRDEIASYIRDNFFVVQLNLYGDTEVTDFDGEILTEKQAAQKWGLLFTPSILFLPEEVPEGQTAQQAAVALMPGAFGAGTTIDMFTWVNEKRYELDNGEDFQRYHARRIQERDNGSFD